MIWDLNLVNGISSLTVLSTTNNFYHHLWLLTSSLCCYLTLRGCEEGLFSFRLFSLFWFCLLMLQQQKHLTGCALLQIQYITLNILSYLSHKNLDEPDFLKCRYFGFFFQLAPSLMLPLIISQGNCHTCNMGSSSWSFQTRDQTCVWEKNCQYIYLELVMAVCFVLPAASLCSSQRVTFNKGRSFKGPHISLKESNLHGRANYRWRSTHSLLLT